MVEREETGTDGGWDLLQEPQGDSAGSQPQKHGAAFQQVRAQSAPRHSQHRKLPRQDLVGLLHAQPNGQKPLRERERG